MSDFFTRLAERAVGAMEVMTPRVPHRFEQPMTAMPPVPLAEQDDEQASVIEDANPRTTRPGKDPLPARAKNPTMPTPHQEEGPPRDVPPSTQQPLSGPEESIFHSESPRVSIPPTIETVSRIKNLSTSIQQSIMNSTLHGNDALMKEPQYKAAQEKERQAPRTEVTDVVHAKTESRSAQAITPTETSKRSAQANTPTETFNRSAPQPGPRPEQDRQLPYSTPQVQRSSRLKSDQEPQILRPRQTDERDLMRTAAASPREQRTQPSQEPTIKVTIGRIEVRAMMQPPKAPAKSRQPAKSAISLDEYLTRHKERRA